MRPLVAMDEARRQHYLKAMGIPMWYARGALPGAKPSPEYDFSGFDLPVVEPEVRPLIASSARVAKPSQGAASLLKKVVQNLALPASQDAPIPAPVREIPQPASEEQMAVEVRVNPDADVDMLQVSPPVGEVPEFCVRAYQAGPYLALNLAHPDIDSHREAALFANLAAACWGTTSEFLCEMAWPVFSNHRLPGQHAEMAQAVLARMLQEYLDNKEGLILFGQPPLWPARPLGTIASADQMAGLPKTLPLLSTWSLGEMLLVPQRKRDVWLHLRHFSGAH